MKSRKEVHVDLQELCIAYSHYSADSRYYLDLETGEVIYVSEFMDEDLTGELEERIEEGYGERIISIPCESSEEGYRDMEDFIVTVEDERVREKLIVAVNGRGAFKRFKDVLLDYSESRGRWFRFKEGRVLDRVMEWLESEGIDVSGAKESSD